MARKIYIFLAVIALILLDQLSKHFMQGANWEIIPDIASFHYTTNSGAAFGMMQGWNFIFVVASIIIAAIILWHFEDLGSEIGALLLVSGAIGNLIDRIFFGFVRDFISISIWPTFNLADSFGVIGVLLIALHSFKIKYFKKANGQ
ncbi:MAG: signal peptidase II [Candidatus Woesearchaeota archaeon]